MKCQKCGFVSFDDLKSCKKCGTSLSLPEGEQFLTPGGGKSGSIQKKTKGADQRFLLPSNFDETIESIKQDLEAIDGSPQKATSVDDDSKKHIQQPHYPKQYIPQNQIVASVIELKNNNWLLPAHHHNHYKHQQVYHLL